MYPFFSDVGASDLQWISEIISEDEVKAGDYVFHENESGDIFYIVKEGEVQIRKGDILLESIEVGEYFGEIAIFDRQPRTADALAKRKNTATLHTPERLSAPSLCKTRNCLSNVQND